MVLYLVQHAEAKSKDEDPSRDLTEKGRMDIESVAHHLKRLKASVNRILHSGKTRALTTAAIMAEHLQPPSGVEEVPGLAPLDAPRAIYDRIAATEEDLMVVGHLPHLARLAALLMCGDQEKDVVHFQMGGAVRLRLISEKQWVVEWIILPETIL